MRATAAASLLVAGLTLTACSPTTQSHPPTSPSSVTSPGTAPSGEAAWGVAGDEPCSRTIPLDAIPAPIGFRAEDLERMVLTREDLGGLPGFEQDLFAHGYLGNAELEMIEVHPTRTCDDLKLFGRVSGFGESHMKLVGNATERVSTSVHLFWDAAGARAWADAFVSGFEASVDTPDGPSRFEVRPLADGEAGDVLAQHVGPEGTRTWAIVVRGPVVGWVVDLHQAATTTIDVPAAAAMLASRIDAVRSDVAGRAPSGPDLAALMSAPLPLADYGDRYAGLSWDSFFGGCADAVERASIAGEEAAADARRFGRLGGCTAMYAPAVPGGPVERVFSSVQVMRDADGASGFLAKALADMQGLGGRPTDFPAMGDEVSAIVTPPGGDRSFTDARAIVRIGPLVATVALQERSPEVPAAAIAALATTLVTRVRALVAPR